MKRFLQAKFLIVIRYFQTRNIMYGCYDLKGPQNTEITNFIAWNETYTHSKQ
jgi:hypothetical protein